MTLPPPTERQARVIWLALTGLSIAVLIALVVALLWGLGRIIEILSPVLWPLAIAGIIACLLDPVVDLIESRGAPRPAAIVSVFALALLIAGCISAYTLVDSRGIHHAAAIPYLELVLAPPALLYVAAVCAAKGAGAVRRELGLPTVFGAAAAFGAYGLALAALRLASAASVAAVRETSVVIAVVLAAPVLRERVGPARMAGAVFVVAGVALLSLA